MSEVKLPTVDVIIPAYNAGRFIAVAIQSVLDQTHLPRKIIIVDDGSTDDTIAIIKSFKSNCIKLIPTEHYGVSHARNTGIKASKATYIAFLDSDDAWTPIKLETQLLQLRENPAAGVCYTGCKLMNENGVDIKNSQAVPYARGQVFKDILFYEHPIFGSASSVMVLRQVLLQTKLFDETMEFSEDIDLWAHLALVTEFDYVKEPCVRIRSHPSSTTRNKNWVKCKKIQADHFFYINKFANVYYLPKETLLICKGRIIRLFFEYPSKLLELCSFYELLEKKSPHLLKQMKCNNKSLFCGKIFWMLCCETYKRFMHRLLLFDRLKLFFSEGTFFFSKSKYYNPDLEFIRKKR